MLDWTRQSCESLRVIYLEWSVPTGRSHSVRALLPSLHRPLALVAALLVGLMTLALGALPLSATPVTPDDIRHAAPARPFIIEDRPGIPQPDTPSDAVSAPAADPPGGTAPAPSGDAGAAHDPAVACWDGPRNNSRQA